MLQFCQRLSEMCAFLLKSRCGGVCRSGIFRINWDQAMKTKDDVLERIKKLMALSHSANPNEAAVALSQAQKLMQRNNLTVKEVMLSDIGEERADVLSPLRERRLSIRLGMIIANAFGLDYLMSDQSGAGFRTIIFIGPKDRLESAVYVFTILSRQAVNVKKDASKEIRNRVKASVMESMPELRRRYGMDLFIDLESVVSRLINSNTRKQVAFYMSGWFEAISEKVAKFAVGDSERLLIEEYKGRYSQRSIRSRRRYVNSAEASAYRSGVANGRDSISLFRGVKGIDHELLE